MIKGKRGQLALSIISGIMIFMIGMVVVNLLKPEITTARSATELDCDNSSISDGSKATCLIVDFTIPYFFIVIFSVAGGAIVGRVLG